MKFIWAKSEKGKYHLVQMDFYIYLHTVCGLSLREDSITLNHKPHIDEYCKNCLKMIEGFRNMYHPTFEPSYARGLREGEEKAFPGLMDKGAK